MMATAVFSQHSSNPLEVGSSDQRNREYRRRVQTEVAACLSEDPEQPFMETELNKYHRHLADMFPNISALQNQPEPQDNMQALVDLDDDEEMDYGEVIDDMHESELPASDKDVDEGIDLDYDTDEEQTIQLRPLVEREEIEKEITELEAAVPQLDEDYRIIDRLGTGTFSSVYKAVDLGYHNKWDNQPWQGIHPPSSSAHYQSIPIPSSSKAFVAIKRIYVTSNPERIRNEIAILEDCRSCRHVSQIITAFRHEDQVVVIMPYHRNVDFRDYYRQISMDGIRAYMRCMIRALRDIHARDIIHRDVKPANFLYDPRTGVGTLCDFGLACRIGRAQSQGMCLHGAPTREHPHGRLNRIDPNDINEIKKTQRDARNKSMLPSEKVGYPENDPRPQSKANRAGTRGFRAPEVLFKCGQQSGALDMWAAGIILLFFLTGKFPLFQSNDDMEALIEIACVVGKRKMEKAATLHSRSFISNLPTLTEGMSWKEFVEKQNPLLYTPRVPDPRMWPHNQGPSMRQPTHPPTSSSPSTSFAGSSRISPSSSTHNTSLPNADAYRKEVDDALDFVEKLLEPEATKRIQPLQALRHRFLREDDTPDDDELVPHIIGEGRCRDLHAIDADIGQHCVKVRVMHQGRRVWVVREVEAGQGVAIGNRPCEFHIDDIAELEAAE